jgi:hypothetical protein
MFKRTAVPPAGPSEHQARQPLNMALGLSIAKSGGMGHFGKSIGGMFSRRFVTV